MNKYQEAKNFIAYYCAGYLPYDNPEKNIKFNDKFVECCYTLQELIDICTQPNSIKLKLDHIQDVLDSCYETDEDGFEVDNSEWNDDVGLADDYLQDIKMAYSFRVEDTRIVNELQELLGCSADNIIKRVKQLDIALDNTCKILNEYSYCKMNWECRNVKEKGNFRYCSECVKENILKESEQNNG